LLRIPCSDSGLGSGAFTNSGADLFFGFGGLSSVTLGRLAVAGHSEGLTRRSRQPAFPTQPSGFAGNWFSAAMGSS